MNTHRTFHEPPYSHVAFNTTKLSWLWLIVRFYLAYTWIEAAWEKFQNPAWVGSKAGVAITGFVKGALAKTGGAHPDVQGWYASFLQWAILPHPVLWSHMIAWGELLVGIGLVLGALTGIAAFFGLFMNLNFLLAGTVSTNPILFVLSIFLVLAWKVGGYYGLDRWLLPLLGTPWEHGIVFHHKHEGDQA
jgi:thiosulfate dehydrogenase (quinone) large subunit